MHARVSLLSSFLNASMVVLILLGCGKKENVTDKNLVRSGDPEVRREIGEEKNRFGIFGTQALSRELENKRALLSSSDDGKRRLITLASGILLNSDQTIVGRERGLAEIDESLILAYPVGLLHQQHLFGGVITEVSDTGNESLGALKLSDLPALHVRTEILKKDEKFFLTLLGCASQCSELSPQLPILAIPILAIDAEKQVVFVDLSSLGEELNLIRMLDPEGEYTKLQTKSSATKTFDYSLSTLVFDVEVLMVPIDPAAPPTEVRFTIRWYLKLASSFSPVFQQRPATEGVGYFMTERSIAPRVQRFSLPALMSGTESSPPVKYYIKDVPAEFQPAFAAAFDGWNEKFVEMVGRKLLSYEFIGSEDSRHEILVAGDVRYNVMEWDVKNLAPYGGLGPSIANQFTGEIFSANVLVQGPKIIEIYRKWFGNPRQPLRLDFEVGSGRRFGLSLGEKLAFRIVSQVPPFQDPIMQRDDFEPLPAGVSFDSYMRGYFIDLVEHELGHNLGLRHNFRGNLGAAETPVLGGVSLSVMEYLGRGFRYLDRIGPYDVMALRYGYLGVLPHETTLFCTDENVVGAENLENSAECSRDDATRDPFRFFENRLVRAIDLLLARGSTGAPGWSVQDMDRELSVAIGGLSLYAATAEKTGHQWSQFFGAPDRPKSVSEVKGYVLSQLKNQLCDAGFSQVVLQKESEEARQKTMANIRALREKAMAVVDPLKIYPASDLKCE